MKESGLDLFDDPGTVSFRDRIPQCEIEMKLVDVVGVVVPFLDDELPLLDTRFVIESIFKDIEIDEGAFREMSPTCELSQLYSRIAVANQS